MFKGMDIPNLDDMIKNLAVITLYRSVAEIIFMDNRHGPYVDIFRTTYNMIMRKSQYRGESEFKQYLNEMLEFYDHRKVVPVKASDVPPGRWTIMENGSFVQAVEYISEGKTPYLKALFHGDATKEVKLYEDYLTLLPERSDVPPTI
jgi:hypothetical protein